MDQRFKRREFVSSAVTFSGMVGAAALLRPAPMWGASSKFLDPVDPNIRYGITGSLWGDWPDGNLRMSTDMRQIVSDTARFGLQGIEPYAGQAAQFLGNPLALKRMCEAADIALIDVGDLPRTPAQGAAVGTTGVRGGANPWLEADGNAELVAEMVSFARDFLAPCGCDHWKSNMGSRPAGGPDQDQLKRLADTLNEIGRQTIAFGVRLAPHPHIWGPMEREHEIRTVLSLTDPKYVWLTVDTAHLTLGGMDPVKIIGDYFPRVAEVHLKDTYPKYRANTSTPTQAEHHLASLYHNLGAGGVDFPAIFKLLRGRNFKGWVVYDLDAPRPDDGTGSTQDNLAVNIDYLREAMHVNLPKPPL
ncbi:MAG: sugar phosphate isomerase/epimerase [Bryobacteraceae bacterium]|jgi:sugar phosphate isomerase/epimerase